MQHYDGNGNITQVDHVVFDGTPPATGVDAWLRHLHRESGLHRSRHAHNPCGHNSR